MSAAHTNSLHPVDALEIGLRQPGRANPEEVFSAGSVEHLPTALELLALRWMWAHDRGDDLFDRYPALGTPLAQLQRKADHLALFRLGTASGQWSEGHLTLDGADVFEIPAPGEAWRTGRPFMLAQEEFSRRLRAKGLSRYFAAGLTGAFDEMASNAVEHSLAAIPPVACLQVTDTYWAFSVTDVGRGALASLRSNPKFESLKSGFRALRLALKEGVSRHPDRGRGRGFSIVFKALVDRSATLRFRSGGAAGHWTGTSPTAHRILVQALPVSRVCGFHMNAEGYFFS